MARKKRNPLKLADSILNAYQPESIDAGIFR